MADLLGLSNLKTVDCLVFQCLPGYGATAWWRRSTVVDVTQGASTESDSEEEQNLFGAGLNVAMNIKIYIIYYNITHKFHIVSHFQNLNVFFIFSFFVQMFQGYNLKPVNMKA